MIAEDVKRKIWLWGMTGVLVAGVLFLVWAVFLNRGTIIIHAQNPYTFTVEGLRTENCFSEICSTVVAPGDYTITVKKDGYKTLSKQISVPLGRPYEESIQLEFIPTIVESKSLPNQVFPPDPELTQAQRERLKLGGAIKIFFDEAKKIFCFVVVNSANSRQTLYMATYNHEPATKQTTQETQNENGSTQQLSTGEIGEPVLVTSFLRDLQGPLIYPSQDGNKIGIIDQMQGESILYLVDRQAKNRVSLATFPMIRSMQFIRGTNDFLFQAREKSGDPESLYLYRWDQAKIMKLEIKTPLYNTTMVDNTRLIAATNQALASGKPMTGLEGQLISLGNNGVTQDQSPSVYAFVEYSLVTHTSRLIAVRQAQFPSGLALSEDKKSVNFLQGTKVYVLRFEE